MSLILFIGLLGVFLVIFLKRPLIDTLGKNNKLVHKLKNAKWFQNHWLSGIFLFVMNAVLFFSTGLVLYALMYLFIPFVHLLVMFLAVIGSIFSIVELESQYRCSGSGNYISWMDDLFHNHESEELYEKSGRQLKVLYRLLFYLNTYEEIWGMCCNTFLTQNVIHFFLSIKYS